MTPRRTQLVLAGVLSVLAPCAMAASPDPSVAIAGAANGIRVDGVLDEPAWALATPLGPLLQRDPNEGASASEATEVRVLFDADTLYVGVICRDRTPASTSCVRREVTPDWAP